MKIPKTNWNYSNRTEGQRVVFTLKQTLNRFYAKTGFLVLPYLVSGNGKTVFLPNLSLSPGYLDKLKTLKINNFTDIDEGIVSIILEKIKLDPKTQKQAADKQKQWQKLEGKFWDELFGLFPKLKTKIKSVEIRPTRYGSLSSFNLDFEKSGEIFVYLRLDMDISHLAEAIVSAVFTGLEKENYDWGSQEAVCDFLLTQTAMAGLFPNYRTTGYLTSRHESAQITSDNCRYLKKLGLGRDKIFSARKNEIVIDGKILSNHLTTGEKAVLLHLIKNKNRLCDFDSLGDIIWGELAFEKYSDWAVAKLIQRIRNKIEDLGISPCVIQTKRKEGYLLAD